MATTPSDRRNRARPTSKAPVAAGKKVARVARDTNRDLPRGIRRGKGDQRGGGEQQEGRAAVEHAADAGLSRGRRKRVRNSSSSSTRSIRGSTNSNSSSSSSCCWRIHQEGIHASMSLSFTTTTGADLNTSTTRGIKASSRGNNRDQQQEEPSNRHRSRSGGGGGSCDGSPLPFIPTSRRSLGAGAGFPGLFSKARGATLMFLLVVVSAQRGGRAAPAGEMVPLTPDGFQYTANATLSSDNFSLTAALVVDTTTSIVAFPACPNGTTGSNDENNGGACIPYEDVGQDRKWLCNTRTVDGGTVTLNRENSTPNDEQFISFLEDQDVSLAANLSAEGDVYAVFNISTAENSGTLGGWDGAAGVLGLAEFPRTVCDLEEAEGDTSIPSVFSAMDGASSVFALDLGNETYNSTLEVGGYSGYSSDNMGDIEWGESQPAVFPSSWGFSAFDLSVCGRSMMSNVSSFWPAVVSTGSACLGLPEEFFDSLMAWLPVKGTCPADPDKEGAMCSVSEENAAEELPTLSFRLSQNGPEMFIPLSSLLLDADQGLDETSVEGSSSSSSSDRRLCVTREGSIRESGWLFQFPSRQAVVSLGTLPLRSLYTIVDAEAGRVGLAQKVDNAPLREAGNNASCQAAAVCIGMESFKESDNACEVPSCSSYYLTTLDEETMTCESTGIMTILAWVFGIFFGITEMAGHFLRAYYGSTGVGLRGHQHHQGWEFHTGRLIEACLAKVTRTTGRTPHERED